MDYMNNRRCLNEKDVINRGYINDKLYQNHRGNINEMAHMNNKRYIHDRRCINEIGYMYFRGYMNDRGDTNKTWYIYDKLYQNIKGYINNTGYINWIGYVIEQQGLHDLQVIHKWQKYINDWR